MDHPRLFRHHRAHQIARQGINACFIFVKYVNISCINYIEYFIYRFSEAIVPPVRFHQFDVLRELMARQRGCLRHHALTLVLSGNGTVFQVFVLCVLIMWGVGVAFRATFKSIFMQDPL